MRQLLAEEYAYRERSSLKCASYIETAWIEVRTLVDTRLQRTHGPYSCYLS